MSDSLTQTAQAKEAYRAARTRWYELPLAISDTSDVIPFYDEMEEKLDALIAAVLADHDAQTRQAFEALQRALRSIAEHQCQCCAGDCGCGWKHEQTARDVLEKVVLAKQSKPLWNSDAKAWESVADFCRSQRGTT